MWSLFLTLLLVSYTILCMTLTGNAEYSSAVSKNLSLYYCFLQCFDAVGLVIWSVKIVPKMTYKVSMGRYASTHSFTYYVMYKTWISVLTVLNILSVVIR